MGLLSAIVLVAALACSAIPEVSHSRPPIFVSIVCHNEEPKSNESLSYSGNPAYFVENRDATVRFARMLRQEGVSFNFQSDWDFVLGVLAHDSKVDTSGKNVLRHLVEDLEFEVDPHAHEKTYTYADVAYLHRQAGVPDSGLAGGFVAHPPQRSKFEHLANTVHGQQYDCTWNAVALWGGSTAGHVDEEHLWVSGIWKPRDDQHFLEHDDSGRIPHIGGYRPGWEGLEDILWAQQQGSLNPGQIYTQTIMVRQREILKSDYVDDFRQQLRHYTDETERRELVWVGLSEVLRIWHEDYDSSPNQLDYLSSPS